ncbi:zinc ribbon domain-containing protein [Aeromicrobium phragmitis]|uniref:Zinc ribbon domain-containing protein n=1 Tax=Aeromicrobium phragmitis TaxID=2478914 RepID=A0A3L8PJ59_9ACTN|nr:zinc ribbon domain-containing protein [Aeromicrobium phragmitis]RLV55387.1 zinc ribbon domain-containing protein [Aeromicrobium phragmitis]
MATYTFRCPTCQCFDVVQPMSDVRPQHPCPECGQEARRVYQAPHLSTTPTSLRRAADTAAASAETPTVVRSIPGGAGAPRRPRWSPVTGGSAVNASRRARGPHQQLPRL